MPDFDDLVRQRENRKITDEDLDRRREQVPYGEQSMEWLDRWLEVESMGGVGLALFDLPPMVERAHDAVLIDADGNEYLDFLAGFSVSSLGQCNEELTRIIQQQAEKLIHHFDFPHPERVKLAEKLAGNTPIRGDARVAFGVTGSDATELAIRAARYHTGKQMILSPYGDYHGVTYGSMSTTGKGGMQSYFYPITPQDSGVGHFPFPYPYQSPFGRAPEGRQDGEYTLAQLRHYLEYTFGSKESPFSNGQPGSSNVAAFLVSPLQCSAGYIKPPEGYLRMIREFTDQHDILLIVDEIQTGLGRTGKLWATEWEDVEADMLLTSKALGGGLPISAVVASDEILESWGPGAHVSTQAGTVVACAAGNRAFEILSDESFLTSVREKGEHFTEGLNRLREKYTVLGDVDTKGLFTGLELVKDEETREPASDATDFVLRRCVEEGMVMEKGGYFFNRLQLIPPLTVDVEVLDRALEILDRVFEEADRRL